MIKNSLIYIEQRMQYSLRWKLQAMGLVPMVSSIHTSRSDIMLKRYTRLERRWCISCLPKASCLHPIQEPGWLGEQHTSEQSGLQEHVALLSALSGNDPLSMAHFWSTHAVRNSRCGPSVRQRPCADGSPQPRPRQ